MAHIPQPYSPSQQLYCQIVEKQEDLAEMKSKFHDLVCLECETGKSPTYKLSDCDGCSVLDGTFLDSIGQ